MNWNRILIICFLIAILVISCKKEDEKNGQTSAVFNSNLLYGTMTDQEGNIYKTIQIGDQTWMAENLRTTKYTDGSVIPNISEGFSWMYQNVSMGKCCTNQNSSNNDTITTYGRLYNWYALNTGKLCPKGWHIPTDTEWTTLINILGGDSISGGKLKEKGFTHWVNPNLGADNESGFTALPAGNRDWSGGFDKYGKFASWWSLTEHDLFASYYRTLRYDSSKVYRAFDSKSCGFSVRFVKD
jgi:uncharacterized protein (TIGR02145 family)